MAKPRAKRPKSKRRKAKEPEVPELGPGKVVITIEDDPDNPGRWTSRCEYDPKPVEQGEQVFMTIAQNEGAKLYYHLINEQSDSAEPIERE